MVINIALFAVKPTKLTCEKITFELGFYTDMVGESGAKWTG